MDRDRGSRWSLGKAWLGLMALAALIAVSSGLTGPVAQLQAAESGATDASLTWKVSQYAWTFNSLAQSHDVTAPAFKDPDNGFVFPQGVGTYDPETGETSIDFTGALQLGNTSAGGYKIQLIDPSIVVDSAGAGSLIADVTYCTGSAGSSPCSGAWPLTANVVVVNFDASSAEITDTGSEVSWTITPDYPLQGNPDFPARRQFPQSFLDSLAAASPSLLAHFRDSGSGNDPNKPPAPITLTFSYGGGTGATQTIRTEVSADGALSISVAGDSVVLPSPVLNTEGNALVSSGSINNVIVTDLRQSNPGWSVNGQVSDFTSDTSSFGGQYLGWTPDVVSTSASQEVTAGADVLPGSAPGEGLSSSRGLGSAADGAGRGTAELVAGLDLQLPTSTQPGQYSATLTLTVI